MNTYLVTFRRTPFDIVRELRVMADTPEEAKRTLKDIEGQQAIVSSVRRVAST